MSGEASGTDRIGKLCEAIGEPCNMLAWVGTIRHRKILNSPLYGGGGERIVKASLWLNGKSRGRPTGRSELYIKAVEWKRGRNRLYYIGGTSKPQLEVDGLRFRQSVHRKKSSKREMYATSGGGAKKGLAMSVELGWELGRTSVFQKTGLEKFSQLADGGRRENTDFSGEF